MTRILRAAMLLLLPALLLAAGAPSRRGLLPRAAADAPRKSAVLIYLYYGDSKYRTLAQESLRLVRAMEGYDFKVLLKHESDAQRAKRALAGGDAPRRGSNSGSSLSSGMGGGSRPSLPPSPFAGLGGGRSRRG